MTLKKILPGVPYPSPINKLAASGFPVGEPNILWMIVLMGMMPPSEDTNPVRRKNRDQQISQKEIPIV